VKHIKTIKERALDVDKYPDTYLAPIKKGTSTHRKFADEIAEIYQMFKDLRWQDIKWLTVHKVRKGDTAIEVPLLPRALRSKINKAYQLNPGKMKAAFEMNSKSFNGTWNGDQLGTGRNIYMEVEGIDEDQRTHFPDGIPTSLRGYKLGYKLYRSLLEKYKYLSSNTSGTTDKDRVWQSIISPKTDKRGRLTEDDVHSILGKDFVFAMVKNISIRNKILFAKRYITSNVDADDITKKNFGMDDELKKILPNEVLADVDPKKKEEKLKQLRRERLLKYTPNGVKSSRWDIGDYVVSSVEMDDVKDTQEHEIIIRKVVGKDDDGDFVAIPLDKLRKYERTGEKENYETTSDKTDWVKAKLQPGQEDPTAGRLVVAGTAAKDREDAVNNAYNIKRFMRYEDYDVWASRDMADSYIAKEGNGRKKSVMNVQNGRVTEQSNSDLVRMRLKKMTLEDITRKTDVEEGDYVFVKEHRRYVGKIFKVYRITPASNRQPGVYLAIPKERPLYISDMSTLAKITNPTNESLSEGFIISFDDFTF
jgi:hypothetical protein